MKVLFISLGLPDYQCDCLLHGFYNILGPDLTHTDDYQLMYSQFTNSDILKKTSGRGFTIWGNLPVYYNDNSDIENKIKNKYFDYVIFGSIRRNQDFIELVKDNYPKNKIAVIDGEDDQYINNVHELIYFKRELVHQIPNIFPISFSIPKEKIIKDLSSIKKSKFIADYIPSSPGTGYIFETEKEYYANYQEAYFGITHKKGGWDCMRHYEILANYCLPYFEDLHNCPLLTLNNFPKKDILDAKNIKHDFSTERYYDILNRVFSYTENFLITDKSAEYIINTLINL